jgi:hypothetical protein
MKTLFAAILIAFVIYQAKGQDTLTIGEVYDYEPGDQFHYNEHYQEFYGSYFFEIRNVEIINKYYSVNNDTVYYVLTVSQMDSTSEEPYWNNHFLTDTIPITHLLEYPYEIDSIYTDPLLYNGRTINRRLDEFDDGSYIDLWVRGCGLAYHYYFSWYAQVYHVDELVYYNKNGEEWGTPLIVTGFNEIRKISSLINIFPNPAASFITLTAPGDLPVEEVIIYNHLGQKFLTAKPENNTVDVSGLKAGMYMIEVKTKDFNSRQKLIKQ